MIHASSTYVNSRYKKDGYTHLRFLNFHIIKFSYNRASVKNITMRRSHKIKMLSQLIINKYLWLFFFSIFFFCRVDDIVDDDGLSN